MKWQGPSRGQCRNGKCNNPVKKPCVNDQLKDYIAEDGDFNSEVYFFTMLEIITYTDQAKAIAQFSEVYDRAFEWRFKRGFSKRDLDYLMLAWMRSCLDNAQEAADLEV